MLLKLSYLGLSALMTILLIAIESKWSNRRFYQTRLFVFLIGWNLYMYLLSLSGMIDTLEFPPRFALLLILPAFILTGIFAYRNRKSRWLANIPPPVLIYYQSFRVLVETLFVFSVSAGILHSNVTIEGYNYDMVFGFSALIIGWIFSRNLRKFRRMALIWNYLGLAVIAFIIFLFQSTIYFPEIYGPDVAAFPIEFIQYPYLLVAGFLMPSAVFVHVLSIVQLRNLPKDMK